jgi:hypothetical protein
MKAVWNGAVIAESDDIVMVEGNAYFPAAALRMEHVRYAIRDLPVPGGIGGQGGRNSYCEHEARTC